MPNKVKITDLKKTLKNTSKDKLEKLLCEIYKKDNFAVNMINCSLFENESEEQILNEYRSKIDAIFFPTNYMRGYFSISGGKKLIMDFKKITSRSKCQLDLMLYYVECGTEFTNNFGDIDMAFYKSLMSVFDNFVSDIYKQPDEKMYLLFKERLATLSYEAEGIGWGYGDYIQNEIINMQYEYAEEEPNV